MNAFLAVISMGAGNFIYQFMQDIPQMDVAAERTFFQMGAIAIYVIMNKLQGD